MSSGLESCQAVTPLPAPSKTCGVSNWKPAVPISPPMSHHAHSPLVDSSSAQKMEEQADSWGRAASTGAPPRQQLPSLSSLFGSHAQMRPLMHSPLSDRLSPYSAPSPLDRQPATSAPPERSLSGPSSYFPASSHPLPPPPPLPVAPSRRTYDGQHGQGRAPCAQSPATTRSPGTHDAEFPRSETGVEVCSPSRWPLHLERDKGRSGCEASVTTGDSRYQTPQAHVAGQGRPSEGSSVYRESVSRHPHSSHGAAATSATAGPNPPSTPVGPGVAVSSESATGKDGLGPKIWTGSHFLPRFVRAAEVPGEGMCYFYDDGSHCKTVIDGEAVNAHWGVTKAGKPRKRLAIACVTCREKKIKCDPDYPRCIQCEKFGRVCKFKNA